MPCMLGLSLLLSKVTDVQGTLVIVNNCVGVLRCSNVPAAQESYKTLPGVIAKLQVALNQVVELALAC